MEANKPKGNKPDFDEMSRLYFNLETCLVADSPKMAEVGLTKTQEYIEGLGKRYTPQAMKVVKEYARKFLEGAADQNPIFSKYMESL